MSEVVIAGIGQVPVGEHWELSLRTLGARAALGAIRDAGGLNPQAMYIGNVLAPVLSHQSNLGALISERAGLDHIEAYTVEAAGASGAAAFRMGYLAIRSGFVDTALVLGVEKFTDRVGPPGESAMAETTDYDFEAVPGLTPTGQAALLMARYLYEYGLPANVLAGFPLIAHENAVHNPNAMYRRAITREAYEKTPRLNDPLNLYDAAPYADGAAALILTRPECLPVGFTQPLVRVTGSSNAIDTLALHDRHEPLSFNAARHSVEQVCRQAGILPGDVDFFELCDSYSIYAALSLEAAGFARPGEGWKLAEDGSLALNGKLPILTMGGQKARGNPPGAAGVYQLAEASAQLRGTSGKNQLKKARRGLVQSLGGPAATAVTHILERWEK